jgi:NAD(P)-dependent dehydrogenase (short-subunit alcohol dehydrogenase family)
MEVRTSISRLKGRFPVSNKEAKIILISGAKGGLGAFVTNAFLESGAKVIGVSQSIAASDFPHENFTAMPADISTGGNAKTLVDAVLGRWGRIDGLVHLIGGFAGGQTVDATDDATIDRMLNMNYRSAFYIIRAVLPTMRVQSAGRIIAIGSKAAVEPQALVGAYAASKAALVSLVRTVAHENSDKGIAANVVLPGTMDTPANRAGMPGADFSNWVQPGQVARLLVHLALGDASQVSGAVIPVYGFEA